MQVYYEPDVLHAKQRASDSNLSYIHSMVYTLPLTYTVNMPFKISQQIFSSAVHLLYILMTEIFKIFVFECLLTISLIPRPDEEKEKKGPGFSHSCMHLIISELTTCWCQ